MARQYSDLAPEINRLERRVRHAASRFAEAFRAGSGESLLELM